MDPFLFRGLATTGNASGNQRANFRAVHRFAWITVIVASVTVTEAIAETQRVFPSKPVRVVVPSSAGGPPDILARLIGSKLAESWGQPVLIDNRPGAATVIGTNLVAKASPDGYTLLLAPGAFITTAVLQPNLPYNPLKDFAGITQLGSYTAVLVVAPALGVSSVHDLIALAQAKPGEILFGSAGANGVSHLNAERFSLAAGIKTVHVGHRGQPKVATEVFTGRIHYAALALPVVLPFVRDGKLLALAVLDPQRSPVLPGVPALVETLPGLEKGYSSAMLAPAGTTRMILNHISKEIARIIARPNLRGRMQAMGFVPAPSTPEDQDRIRREQINSLSRLAIAAGLKTK